jgi:hypothetical protein
MEVIVVCSIVAVLLFAAAFVTRRRFGLLGLALAAGSILMGIWGSTAELIVGAAGFKYSPLTNGITLGIVVLLPAIVLLFHGSTYKSTIGRLVGAALFTLLALAFLIDPIGRVLTLQGYGAVAYLWLVNHKSLIIGGGLIIAVLDLFLTKPVSFGHDSKGKH